MSLLRGSRVLQGPVPSWQVLELVLGEGPSLTPQSPLWAVSATSLNEGYQACKLGHLEGRLRQLEGRLRQLEGRLRHLEGRLSHL